MPLVTTWKNAVLNRIFRNVALTVPSSVLFAPYSVIPAAADGTGGTAITGNGATTPTVTWGAVSARQASNSATANVGTASANWPLCTAFALTDQVGGMIAFGPTSPSRQVNSGQNWTLQAGEIQIADVAAATDTFISDYAINAVLTELLGGSATTFPASPWWALLTAPYTSAGTGGTEVSTSATNYGRVQQACSAASAGVIGPSAQLAYLTPSGAWGTIGWLAAFTASSGGTLLAQAPLVSPLTVSATSPAPTFSAARQSFSET